MGRKQGSAVVPDHGGLISRELDGSGPSGSGRDELAYWLLCLVAVRPMSSYDVTRALRSVIRHMWGAADSQVHSGLARLEHQGLVTAEEVRTGQRSRRV